MLGGRLLSQEYMQEAPRSIALVSHVWLGHVPAYHKRFADAFRAEGLLVREVILDSGRSESLLSNPFEWTFKRMANLLRRSDLFELMRAFLLWRRIARAVGRCGAAASGPVDAVFFTYLDVGLMHLRLSPKWIEKRLPKRWAGVVVHPQAVHGGAGPFPGPEGVLRAETCRAVVVLDERFVGSCVGSWPRKRVIVSPDLIDTTAPNKRLQTVVGIREWANSSKIVGLLGVLSRRKNVAGFIALARKSLAAGDDTKFVIVGELSKRTATRSDLNEHREMLRGLPSNCRAWLERVEEEADFNAVVAACDVLFLAYQPAPVNSNILTKAAFFKKPVLMSAGHLMEGPVREFSLGEVVPADDPDAMFEGVHRLMVPSERRDFAGFYALHSDVPFQRTVSEIVEALFA